MHQRQSALRQGIFEFFQHPFPVPQRRWKNHAPMAAQEIGLPRGAAQGFEQRFLLAAERAQSVVTGNDNPVTAKEPVTLSEDTITV